MSLVTCVLSFLGPGLVYTTTNFFSTFSAFLLTVAKIKFESVFRTSTQKTSETEKELSSFLRRIIFNSVTVDKEAESVEKILVVVEIKPGPKKDRTLVTS